MEQEIYQDTYKATIPKVIDYGCIAAAVIGCFVLAALHFRWFWCALLLLIVPFLLSRIPGKIWCNAETVVIQDIYHGRKTIPIDTIQSVDIRVFALKQGRGILFLHHYILEMKIRTDGRTCRFRMDDKGDGIAVQFPGYLDLKSTKSSAAFLRLKRYIETTQQLNDL